MVPYWRRFVKCGANMAHDCVGGVTPTVQRAPNVQGSLHYCTGKVSPCSRPSGGYLLWRGIRSGSARRLRGQIPGQQLADPVDLVVGDADQRVLQPGFRVVPVQSGRADQAVDRGCPFAAGIRSQKQVVLAPQRHTSQSAFGGIVVDLDTAVACVARQRFPLIQRVLDRGRCRGFARAQAQLCLQSVMQTSRRGVVSRWPVIPHIGP